MSLQDALTQDHKQFSRCIKQQKSNPAGGWGTSPWWCPKKGRAGGGIGTAGHFGDTGTPSWQLQGGIDGTKKAWKWEWGLEKLREPVPLSDRVQEEGEPSARHIGGMLRAFWGWRLLPSQPSASAGAVLPPPAPPVDIAQLCWPGDTSSALVWCWVCKELVHVDMLQLCATAGIPQGLEAAGFAPSHAAAAHKRGFSLQLSATWVSGFCSEQWLGFVSQPSSRFLPGEHTRVMPQPPPAGCGAWS